MTFEPQEFGEVSQEVKDFMLLMCTRKSIQRTSAGECLENPWYKHQSKAKDSKPVAGGVFQNLKDFSAANRFKKAALNIIAHRLDDKSINDLRQTFIRMDANQDGQLTFAEIKEACQSSGLHMADLESLFAHLDLDGSGSIGYTEFLAGMMSQKKFLQEELCWEAFRTFDRDGSGNIELEELKTMLQENGEKIQGGNMRGSEVERLFRDADTDGDGKISFEEFLEMVRK